MLTTVECPFGYCPVTYRKCLDLIDCYDLWIPMADERTIELKTVSAGSVIDEVLMRVANCTAEQLFFIEKPALGIDVNGNIVGL